MSMYHEGNRELQDLFGTRPLADRMEDAIVSDSLSEGDQAFIEARDMFFLATADENGRPNVGYRGGDPGFVRVLDERTMAFPSYNGNGMYVNMGNLRQNAQISMLFIDWERRTRRRVSGIASIETDDPLMAEFPECQFIVRVNVTEAFSNCPRYVHRMQRVERSPFVPQADCVTPVPEWKKGDWVADVLPEGDPARDPSRPVA
jgi:hypothetical protein